MSIDHRRETVRGPSSRGRGPADPLGIAIFVALLAGSSAGAQPQAPVEATPTPPAEVAAEPSPAAPTPATSEPAATAPPAVAAEPPTPPFSFRARDAIVGFEMQVRTRGEERMHPYLGAFGDSETHFVTSRFRVGARLEWHALRMRVQAQEARDFGTVPPGTEASNFGVHQSYAELFRERSFLRVGRQEVAYGDERLVGPLDWASLARSFDGVRAHHVVGDFSFDAMAAIVSYQQRLTVQAATPTTPAVYARTGGDTFAAAQLGFAPADAFHGELLYLYRRDRATVAVPTNDRRISAISLRAAGDVGSRFRYVAEGIFEFGADQRAQFLAYAALADVFVKFPSAAPTTLGTGFALGSGDRAGRVGEFENFFPTNHKFYGYADLFGLRNLVEGHASITQQFAERKAQVQLQAYAFFLEQTTARWTNAGGAVVAAANASNTDRYVGFETDATVSYRVHELFTVSGGYSIFVPGAAADTLLANPSSPLQHWAFLMLDFRTP